MNFRYCAVVVLYEPDDSVIENIHTYDAEVGKIYVIDNSNHYNHDLIYKINEMNNTVYVDLHGNQGLAKALNYGCGLASSEGYDYVLTMDQDSYFDEDAVRRMLDWADQQTELSFGIAAPCVNAIFYDENGKKTVQMLDHPDHDMESAAWVMTSGGLMSLKAFEQVGMFDEALFIEHIDIDIGIRFFLNGFKIVKLRGVRINQRLGNSKPCRFLWKTIHPMFASPVRTYYLVRNQIYTIKKYGLKLLKFTNVSLWKTLVKIVCYESDKKQRLRMFSYGIVDGVKNRMGEYRR